MPETQSETQSGILPDALLRLTSAPFLPRGQRPIWLQIQDRVRAACLDGTLVPGGRLPGENQLAEAFGVTRVTLRRAFARLQQEGLLQARKGVGIFVRPMPLRYTLDHGSRFADGLAATDRQVSARTVSLMRGAASAAEAAALGLRAQDEVIRIIRLRLVDGAAVYRAVKVFPAALFPDFEAAYAVAGSVRDVYFAHGLTQYHRAETRVTGGFASRSEAEDLQLTRDTPVLRTVATNTCPAGRPIEFNSGTWLFTAVELVMKDPAKGQPEGTQRPGSPAAAKA